MSRDQSQEKTVAFASPEQDEQGSTASEVDQQGTVPIKNRKQSSKNKEENSTSSEAQEIPEEIVQDPFAEDEFTIASSNMGKEEPSTTTAPIQKNNIESSANSVQENINIPTELHSPTLVAENWPVQLVGILGDATPKRALIRKANGMEISVQAGAILQEENLVVLAIGKDHVSVAKIHPQGDVTSIQQIDLQPLY